MSLVGEVTTQPRQQIVPDVFFLHGHLLARTTRADHHMHVAMYQPMADRDKVTRRNEATSGLGRYIVHYFCTVIYP